MPVREPTVIAGDKFTVRHVGPKADIWPGGVGAEHTVLANSTMVARPLPSSSLPSSPDLCAGMWTGRMGDNGEAVLTFPNTVASDGVPWRSRFDPTGHLQWCEIYRNGELDFVGVIDQIPTIDQTQVQAHLSDGWWLLKKAYVRDWLVVGSPRDVIERGTGVWVPLVVDAFPAGSSLDSAWTVTKSGSTTVTIGATGGAVMSVPSGGTSVEISQTFTVPSTGTWRVVATVSNVSLAYSSDRFRIGIVEANATNYRNQYWLTMYYQWAEMFEGLPFYWQTSGTPPPGVPISHSGTYTLMIESDGMWISGFINGQLIGCFRRDQGASTSLQLGVELEGASDTATLDGIFLDAWRPFLQQGSDKGDYVLPGDSSTYPNGGLSAQYFNDQDVWGGAQINSDALNQALTPNRWNLYLGSGGPEYMDQTDPQLNFQMPPAFTQTTPGPGPANLESWSAIWSGAVYLKLSAGNYTFSTTAYSNLAMRVWVGKTQLDDQVFDNWTAGLTGTQTFTVSATTLAGTLSYGGGTVARDGWYPIRVEVSVDNTATRSAPQLQFKPPASYTDPGGTALTGGTLVTIPSTSFSPLGCVNQRYQGISHYDLVQQTVQAYGYQASVEPKQLESGLFPGVLAPRVREGHDTDIILSPDRGPRQDGENILNYSSGLDATDFAASMFGNGAGIQTGTGGQLQGLVFDPATLKASLFDAQQWTDFSDASSDQLLHALLNAQLGLQLEPWQLLSADPNGRPREAFTWPLPGTLSKMNWRPGDGLRIQAPDINVMDTIPRQMLTITRNFLPLGISSTQASFTLRPRTPALILHKQLFKANRWARNYQRAKVELQGTIVAESVAAAATSSASNLFLIASDQIVSARVLIINNSTNQSLSVNVNGTAITGSWSVTPVWLDITAYMQPDLNGNVYVTVTNNGTSATTVYLQTSAQVLR